LDAFRDNTPQAITPGYSRFAVPFAPLRYSLAHFSVLVNPPIENDGAKQGIKRALCAR